MYLQLIEHKMTLSVKILKSLTRRGVVMPEYNITLAYSALKPPCLNSDRNRKKQEHSTQKIPMKNIVRRGYQITIRSTRPWIKV